MACVVVSNLHGQCYKIGFQEIYSLWSWIETKKNSFIQIYNKNGNYNIINRYG